MAATVRNRHIVYFFDRGFHACTLVSLHSVLARTPGPLRISLHPTAEAPDLETDAARLASRFPDASIEIRPVDISRFEDLPQGPLPLTSRVRLLLPTLHDGRLLYIDGDTLARKDITPLLDTPLEQGSCVAGAPVPRVALNLSLAGGTGRRADKARAKIARQAAGLGGIDMTRYFNAGIMIFDLDRIAEMGLQERMTDIRSTVDYHSRDQTYLNALFNRHVTPFDPEWNSGWGEVRTGNSYVPGDVQARFRMARENPGILHYKGPEKPWSAPTPPFKASLLLKPRIRRARAKFWREFQAERATTEAVLGRNLWP
ncbi:MAG: glycosyltransferase family 8 protein [Paracoccaceae bacterium]